MSTIQSIEFSREIWTLREVSNWLFDHNIYPIKPIQTYPNYFRVRIQDPRKFIKIRNKKLTEKGIIFSFGFKK